MTNPSRMPFRFLRMLLPLLLLPAPDPTRAELPTGEKGVWLSNAAGERVRIGTVHFTATAGGRTAFRFRLDETRFGEYFLAMRPFRCLAGPVQHLCHFPFGGENEISPADLTPLEYRLIFLHKKPGTLHLESRNGLLWRLRPEGERLVGRLYDADLDPIIVPQGDMRRPVTDAHLQEANEASHWLPRLVIE